MTVATQKKRGKGFYVFPCDGRCGVTYTDATLFFHSLSTMTVLTAPCRLSLSSPSLIIACFLCLFHLLTRNSCFFGQFYYATQTQLRSFSHESRSRQHPFSLRLLPCHSLTFSPNVKLIALSRDAHAAYLCKLRRFNNSQLNLMLLSDLHT